MKKWLLTSCWLLLIVMLSKRGQAQERPLDTWQLHPSYLSIKGLTGNEDIIFASSENGLYRLKAGSSLNTLNKINGLSDQGVGSMQYLKSISALLVGYRSGTIDLIYADKIVNDPALYQLDARLDKTIYDVKVQGNDAFFASALGVIEYDISKGKAQEVYRNIGANASNVACYQLAIIGDSVYAFTDAGLLVGNRSNNLLDFSQWVTRLSSPFSSTVQTACANDSIYFTRNNFLISSWRGQPTDSISFPQGIKNISLEEGGVLIASGTQVFRYDAGTLTAINNLSNIITSVSGELGASWVGIEGGGLYNVDEDRYYAPGGPIADEFAHLSFTGDLMSITFNQDTISRYSDGQWMLENYPGTNSIVKSIDIEGKSYLLDRTLGIYDVESTTFLNRPAQDGAFTDLIYREGIAWVSLAASATPLAYSEDLTNWTVIGQQTLGTATVHSLDQSIGGVTYMISGTGYLLAYERQGGLIHRFDEEIITDYAIDLLDELYVTTNNGLFVYPDASFLSDEGLLEAFISAGSLLQEDDYSAIEIDAGNRKWLATSDGLWLYNENLSNQVAFYDRDTSPIPSNEINSLSFQPTTGLLWIATSQGLVSYQTDAIRGHEKHENVLVFPNPVYLNKGASTIGIKGLADGVTVKITSLAGIYIDEVTAHGSLTSWDLKDYQGNDIMPGIYLIFSSDDLGIETFIGKFLVEP